MKKSRIFATVVYFIFTFGIGVIFSLTLPGYFATFTVPAELISEALSEGDFITCLVLAEPIGFCRTPALHQEFEGGGGVILFETVTEVYDRDTSDDEEGQLTHGMLYRGYTGYVYGVAETYDVFAETNNKTSLKVTTVSGEERVLPLLDYDANGDGTKDGISTFTQSGFILLELRQSDVSSISSLAFTDRTGEAVFTAQAEKELAFQSQFFDCFGDVEAYNELVASLRKEGITSDESEKINEARKDYLKEVKSAVDKTSDCALNSSDQEIGVAPEYQAASEKIGKRANGKAIPFIIIYFVAIYIIADFLLGTHYIIKFFKWFLFKVCRIPHKEKKPALSDEVFGHDYYSMVTLKLDLTEVPEFGGSVEIKYTAGGEEFVFSLLKAEDYTATVRMKAGVYVNPFIDIDRTYAPVDLPDNLIVEGYQTEITVKIVRREV